MEKNEREEELYLTHQTRLRGLEQDLEEYSQKQKRFEKKQEHREHCINRNRQRIEDAAVLWGSSGEANEARNLLEEYVTEERCELAKEEEVLREEHKRIRREQSRWEESYQEELQKLQEESV